MAERDRGAPAGGSDPQPRPRDATPARERFPDRRHRPAGWQRRTEPANVETDGGTEREVVDESTRRRNFEWGPTEERDGTSDSVGGRSDEQPPTQREDGPTDEQPPTQYETDEQAVIDRYEGLLAEQHAEETRKITRSDDREPSRLQRVKLRLLRLLGLR